jgi:hypothetical protein
VPVRDGGPTSYHNGRGVCEHHNYLREMPGWQVSTISQTGEPHTTLTPNLKRRMCVRDRQIRPAGGSRSRQFQPWSLKCSTWWVFPAAMMTSPRLTTVSGVA